jgi:MFS family permease
VCAGTALAVGAPAMFAVIPALVGPEELLNAISLNSVQLNLARTLGPVLAGVVYGAVGPAGCFGLNAAGFVVLTVVLSRIRMPRRPADAPPPVGRAMRDGLRYARAHPVIGPSLLLAAAMSLFGFPYLILLPALARDTLQLDVAGLGYLMTSVGAGAVLGGLGLAAAGDLPHKGLIGIATAFLFGATLAGFAVARSMHATIGVLFTLGVLQTLCMASINTTIQLAVDERMRGRIMSMMTMILFGLTTFGGLLLGTLADRIGVPAALAAGGVAIALTATTVLARAPVLQAATVR